MPPTGAPDNLAYATALAAACQRILAAPDAAALWRTVVDEALALIAADGAAVVSYIEGFWQTLAVRASDSAPGPSWRSLLRWLAPRCSPVRMARWAPAPMP